MAGSTESTSRVELRKRAALQGGTAGRGGCQQTDPGRETYEREPHAVPHLASFPRRWYGVEPRE